MGKEKKKRKQNTTFYSVALLESCFKMDEQKISTKITFMAKKRKTSKTLTNLVLTFVK